MNTYLNIEVIDAKQDTVLNLSEYIFGCDYFKDDPQMRMLPIHEMVRYQQNKMRGNNGMSTQHVKNRNDVAGAHRKIRPQKESGKARQGDFKAPHCRGGGHVFWIQPRSYEFKLNKKYKALALRIALSHKAEFSGMVVVDNFADYKLDTTKAAVDFIKQYSKDDRVLFVTSDAMYKHEGFKGLKNLIYTDIISSRGINVLSILNRTLIFDRSSLLEIQARADLQESITIKDEN